VPSPEVTGKKVTVRFICQRYGIVDRTVGRWIETGVLPPPIYINKIRYFDLAEVDRRMTDRNEAPPQSPNPAKGSAR
jgi:hypothetical protein